MILSQISNAIRLMYDLGLHAQAMLKVTRRAYINGLGRSQHGAHATAVKRAGIRVSIAIRKHTNVMKKKISLIRGIENEKYTCTT